MTAKPSDSSSTASSSAGAGGPFVLTSTAFADGDAIAREFSCDGANVSPPLKWIGVQAGTAALVLVVDDPDARGFVHRGTTSTRSSATRTAPSSRVG
jgi:phosphatidylethanolamine-binding protein (PEBP) family uncharacterized protein